MPGLSVTLKVTLNGNLTNLLIDTGAGCCVVDTRTLKKLNIHGNIQKINTQNKSCMDASGNEMDIVGKIMIPTSLVGTSQTFTQEFRVLNNESCGNIILGRDYLTRYGAVTFDFENNCIRAGKHWLKGVNIGNKQRVVLSTDIILPPRSENIVTVRCKPIFSLLESEFEPNVNYVNSIYAARAQVIPDIGGEFKIALLNVNDSEIKLNRKHKVGTSASESVNKIEVQRTDLNGNSECILKEIKFEPQLKQAERSKLVWVIKEYTDIFAGETNSHKRTEHKIEMP